MGSRWRHRLRAGEALVLVLLAHALRRGVPMRRWAGLLGPTGPAVVAPVVGRLDATEARVAAAVGAATRRTGANCLEQAVAASVMMRLRRRPGVVVIGLDRKDPARTPHAWFVGPTGLVLSGGDASKEFWPASQFGQLTGGTSARP